VIYPISDGGNPLVREGRDASARRSPRVVGKCRGE
jgi:hypothetical protein